jgi:hypothetical protein
MNLNFKVFESREIIHFEPREIIHVGAARGRNFARPKRNEILGIFR